MGGGQFQAGLLVWRRNSPALAASRWSRAGRAPEPLFCRAEELDEADLEQRQDRAKE